MALTKVTGQVIKNTTDVTVGVLTVTNTLAVGGTVSIGGTLTYEDVTNVDAVGLITARNGIVVGSGITLSKDGDIFATGITTISENLKVGTGVTISPDGDGFFTGVVTATSFSGSGANLTNLPAQATIANNADNRVITGGSGVNLNGEADLTFDGTNLSIGGNVPEITLTDANASGTPVSKFSAAGGNINIQADTASGKSDTYIAFSNDGSEKLRIDSSGRVMIGDSDTDNAFSGGDSIVIGNTSSGTRSGVTLVSANDTDGGIYFSDGSSSQTQGQIVYNHPDDSMRLYVDSDQKVHINSGGDLLLGTTSDASLANFGTNTGGMLIDNVGSSNSAVGVSHDTSEIFIGADADAGYLWQDSDHELYIGTNSTKRIIITAGGQMGLGEVTETAIRNNGAGNKTYLIISKGSGTNAPTTYNADEEYIHIGGREYGSGGTGHYYMGFGYTNGVAGDHSPCAIGMQETTASGYTKGNFTIRTRSGTNQNSTNGDRLIVQSNGNVTTVVGGFSDRTQAGVTARKDDSLSVTRLSGSPVEINRQSNDGYLITFYQGNSSEGNISVSGSTVSYNGGHLSRWSQLQGISKTDKSARPTIYQGTVMSNLDELCSWEHAAVLYTEEEKEDGVIPEGKDVGDIKHAAYTEDNQQLNMTKVSDVEGDKDVAGVFWTWDDDDDEIVNDFYVAMTGDMVIRVAASTTISRGDLLISAGDGTAKPQADDIIRSSTIAKIISTNHTATYPDGSKAYPCVLMAC